MVRLTIWCAATVGVVVAGDGARCSPALFTSDGAVISRATGASRRDGRWCCVPAGIAYALDGSLIGAGDYRFLGLAAFGYLVVLVPLGRRWCLGSTVGIVAIWLVLPRGCCCARRSTSGGPGRWSVPDRRGRRVTGRAGG